MRKLILSKLFFHIFVLFYFIYFFVRSGTVENDWAAGATARDGHLTSNTVALTVGVAPYKVIK